MAATLTDTVRFRVRYDESDQMGITYHARYLDWFVIGRTELLRTLGLPYARLEQDGLLLPVLEAHCRYLAATRYDDVVEVKTELTAIGRTRLTFSYEVWCRSTTSDGAGSVPIEKEADAVLVTTGETKHVFVDKSQRPVDVRKRFPRVWETLSPLARRLQSAVGDDVVTEGPQTPNPR